MNDVFLKRDEYRRIWETRVRFCLPFASGRHPVRQASIPVVVANQTRRRQWTAQNGHLPLSGQVKQRWNEEWKRIMEAENHRIGRYFEKGCCHLFLILLCFFRFPIRLYRLTVRTPGSHPSNRGSIPRGGAKKFRSFIGRFFCFWGREPRRAVGSGIACDCRGCNGGSRNGVRLGARA